VNAEPEVKDPATPLPMPLDHELEFDGVGFRYEDEDRFVLEDISFTLKRAGESRSLVPAGRERARLLASPCASGTRRRARSPSEDTTSVGTPGTTDGELGAVLARAQLDELVQRLPRGLESQLGEQGLRLSGGERQRLSVARAPLDGSSLLVLDEPTANLDPTTERDLLDAGYSFTPDRATLVITHRLARMERMDEILVLEGGRIVVLGTHAELAARQGPYRRMLDVQSELLVAV
jgi:ABC-type multidrug transport system fused ATPase/permease subunit